MKGSHAWVECAGDQRLEPIYVFDPSSLDEIPEDQDTVSVESRAIKTVFATLCKLRGVRGDIWRLITGTERQCLEKVAEAHGITKQAVSKACRELEAELENIGFRSSRFSKSKAAVEGYRLRTSQIHKERVFAHRVLKNLSESTLGSILAEAKGKRASPMTTKPASLLGGTLEKKGVPND